MAKKVNKYNYLWVIQFNYQGYGWEDECEYNKKETSYNQVLADLSEYKAAGHDGRYRLISRRELNSIK